MVKLIGKFCLTHPENHLTHPENRLTQNLGQILVCTLRKIEKKTPVIKWSLFFSKLKSAQYLPMSFIVEGQTCALAIKGF